MTLNERVTERLDLMERIANSWELDVWLPSLRRRAERHGPKAPEYLGLIDRSHCAAGCSGLSTAPDGFPSIGPVEWPCPDFRDLCAEIDIDPEADA